MVSGFVNVALTDFTYNFNILGIQRNYGGPDTDNRLSCR